MSKPVKNLIVDTYKRRFDGVESAVIIDIRGIASNDNNALRQNLADKSIKISVVKNSLAKRAWQETSMAGLTDLLDGSCAVAYGGESTVDIARLLVEQAKTVSLKFKGAMMEGELFGPEQVEELSKYPTRSEAQAQVIQIVLGPAGQIIGAALNAGNQIASILQTVKERLEKGKEIKKSG